MPKSVHIGLDIPAGSFSAQEEWLVSNHPVDDLRKYRCNLVVGTSSVVEYTVDGGDNWFKINLGEPLFIKCSYGFDIYVRAGDLLNFRSPTIGTNTLILGRLDSIKDEG